MNTMKEKKGIELYQDLKKKVEKHIQSYMTDLTKHDKDNILKNPGRKFLHIARKYGTHMAVFYPSSEFPKIGERVNYLFSATANRRELLEENNVALEHYIANEPKAFHYFDGEKLIKINKDNTRILFDQYKRSLINLWEEEEYKLNYIAV